MSTRAVWTSTGIIAALIAVRLLRSEGGWATTIFAISVLAAIGALIALLTRRLLVATFVVAALTVLITVAATIKLRNINMVLHAYDFVFLTSRATVSYLWADYRLHLGGAVAAVLAALIAAIMACHIDATRIARRPAAAVFAATVALTVLSHWATGERRHSQFEYEGQYISSFFLSFSETFETLRRGQLLEAAHAPADSAFRIPTGCTPPQRAPHIILIHHESIVPPSLFATLSYDKALDSFFLSDDGQLRKLRVETYGGASTLTEFSILTGLSTYAFGGMRQFVQTMMSGKIKDTLPEALARCGYRNVMFYPMLRSFTMAEKFFAGVGLRDMRDARDQKAQVHNERDRFYYGNAMAEIGNQITASHQPLFAFIETMATHWPYHVPFQPEVAVPGGGPGTHPEMHEYLRRLAMAKADYEHLASELKRRFPAEAFLIVRYGDHHPMSTRLLLGFKEETEAEDVLMHRDSIAFQTFFAVNTINYSAPAPPLFPVLDVPYLGVLLQEAAGLPLSEPWRERQRLMRGCNGRYVDCADQAGILRFHRRLIDSGLVEAR